MGNTTCDLWATAAAPALLGGMDALKEGKRPTNGMRAWVELGRGLRVRGLSVPMDRRECRS